MENGVRLAPMHAPSESIVVSERVAARTARRRPSGCARVDDHHPRAAASAEHRGRLQFERTVAECDAVPATIAVIDGIARIGVEAQQLERLAAAPSALKLSARDLPVAIARGASGGTTVAATALLASRAGIRVFATGGIGGVHRNASETFDESADLGILASCPITVVSAGVKSILDIRATLERLESLSVTVLVFGTDRFPAFWLADSGISVDFSVSSGAEVAAIMRAADSLGRPGGILVANPLAESVQLDRDVHDSLLERRACRSPGSRSDGQGHHAVPARLHPLAHEGTSVEVNLEIVRGNCRLAAEIAAAYVAG